MVSSASVKSMTYGIVAIILLLVGVAWFVVSGKSGRRVDAMDAAITNGDEAALTALLKADPDVTASLNDVAYLLTKAVGFNRVSMVQELLDLGHKGSELQRCVLEHDIDLLCAAIREADADILRMLLASGMKETAESFPPVLMCYVVGSAEHLRVLEIFDATGIAPKQNERGYTPLHVAAFRFAENPDGILNLIRPLLQRGESVNVLTAGGNTPLDMALDVTHESAGPMERLVELLVKHGGRTGRSLRVPQPSYEAAVYFAGDSARGVDCALPEGMSLSVELHPDSDLRNQEKLNESHISQEDAETLLAHGSYLSLKVTGKNGEDPLQVAGNALSVLADLVKLPGVVGFRFEDTYQTAVDMSFRIDEDYNPLLFTRFQMAHSRDNFVLIDTSGLDKFGLSEIELVIDHKLLHKNKSLDLSALVADLSMAAVSGKTAWESGNTANLHGMFCRVGYGKHSITDKAGFVFMMTDS